MSSSLAKPNVRLHASQGLKFITCGLIGAAMEFTIIRILVGGYHVSPYIVYIPSALIPATFVFFFNKHVTFRAQGQTSEQTKRFLMVYVAAFIINYLLSSLFYTLGHTFIGGTMEFGVLMNDQRIAYIAKAMAIGVTAVFNYTFSHLFIFRTKAAEITIADSPVF